MTVVRSRDRRRRSQPLAIVRSSDFDAAGIALPTFAQLADPGARASVRLPPGFAGIGAGRSRRGEPVPRPLVQRGSTAPRVPSVPGPSRRCLARAHGCRRDDRACVRQPIPDDRRAQGAGRATPASRRASVTGQFDPTAHRAIWPSTGNYARGGVAISRIMGCRGVAVLPENMSRERFEWLERVGDRSGRHHPHAGVREQRQGDLRRVRRSSARDPDERRPQPVLRVRQPPRALAWRPVERSRRSATAARRRSLRALRVGRRARPARSRPATR